MKTRVYLLFSKALTGLNKAVAGFTELHRNGTDHRKQLLRSQLFVAHGKIYMLVSSPIPYK